MDETKSGYFVSSHILKKKDMVDKPVESVTLRKDEVIEVLKALDGAKRKLQSLLKD